MATLTILSYGCFAVVGRFLLAVLTPRSLANGKFQSSPAFLGHSLTANR